MESNLVVKTEDSAKRLDQFIADSTGMSRAQVQKLIDHGNVTLAGSPVKKKYRVRKGDIIAIASPPEKSSGLVPENIPLDIVYEDGFLAVINKPHGIVMYPAAGHDRGTLMNAVAFRCGRLASVGGPLRPGVVHRLDRDTSGLVVVALTDEAYFALQQQFKARTITRNYLTLLYGRLKKSSGEIDAAIGRSRSDRKKMSTRTRTGKTAITRFAVLEEFSQASFVKARLATGRTHQIRVHFASIGHPVLGDRTYGGKTSLEVGKRIIRIARQMLHAETLGFIHPVTGKEMLFAAPVPEDMMEILETLRSNR
jgi:23S rRNA pseudouridine1911/1915/1917 synthase